MEIRQHDFETVTVLELKGKITLGEGDEVLKQEVNSVIARGRKQIVLDLEQCPYIDSSGLGEFVRTYTTVSRQGGRLKLCNLTKRITDLLAITKLLTVYETFDSVGEAVASFGIRALEVTCPVCSPVIWMACSRERLLSCPVCDVRFSVTLSDAEVEAVSDGTTTRVSYLWWQTYYENGFGHEQVQLKLGRPCTMSVSGRLDLFAFDVVLRAWDAVSRPRRVVFDMSAVRFFTPASVIRLLELCANTDGASKAAVLWRPASTGQAPPGLEHLVGPSVFANLSEAAGTLETAMDSPQSIPVHLRRRE